MHLYHAHYRHWDAADPFDLRKIRDGISMTEGTLPISLEELYEKEKNQPTCSALSLSQLLEQVKAGDQKNRSATRTEINTFLVSILVRSVRTHWGAVRYYHAKARDLGRLRYRVAGRDFLFLVHHYRRHNACSREGSPESLIWFPNVLFIIIGAILFRRMSKQ